VSAQTLPGEPAPLPRHGSAPGELGEALRTAFLAVEPDIPGLARSLGEKLGSSADATTLIYETAARLNGSLFSPLTHMELVHTEGCNLACTYCFEKDMLGQVRMPWEVARRAIDLLFDYSQGARELEITHFGGEPTLNFEGVRQATEYAERRAAASGQHLEFDMTSNGVLLDEEMVAYFADHHIRVLLSLDGLRDTNDRYRVDRKGRGTFERAMAGLRLLKTRQPWIGVKLTVMPENAARLFDDAMGLYALGVNHFIVGHATGVEWPEEYVADFGRELGRLHTWYRENPRDDVRVDDFEKGPNGNGDGEGAYFGCRAGRSSIAIAVDGSISPCSKVLGFGRARMVGKLGDVWHGITHLRTRSALAGCKPLIAACEEEGIAHEFQGGCFAVNFGETGSLYKPSKVEHRLSLVRRSSCGGCSSSS
jgi:uncharacterized protein